MKIFEYRIVVPLEYAKYLVGNRYMALEYIKSETANGEGIEVIKNEDYKGDGKNNNDVRNQSGTHTYKIYHIKSKIPAFIRWAVPDKYLHFHEESYNSFPHVLTTYHVPGMGKDFSLELESQHIRYTCNKNGVPVHFPENATGLSKTELSKRKIVWLDILSDGKKSKYNLKHFKCEAANLDFDSPIFSNKFHDTEQSNDDNNDDDYSKANEFDDNSEQYIANNSPPEWTKHYKGEMVCAIKVVKFHLKWFGLKTTVEKIVTHSVYPKLFVEAHQRMIRTMNDWYGMSIDDIKKLESVAINDQKKKSTFEE